ncbi:hypothetical protein SARC_12659, partial [Sphaeroforma arctica JP610]
PPKPVGPFRFSVSRHQWVIRDQQNAYDHQARRKAYDDGFMWDMNTKEWVSEHSVKFHRYAHTGESHAFNEHLDPSPVLKEVTDQTLEYRLAECAAADCTSVHAFLYPLVSDTYYGPKLFAVLQRNPDLIFNMVKDIHARQLSFFDEALL